MSDRQNDPRLQRELERRAREKARLDEDSTRKVLASPEGRRFIGNLIHSTLCLSKGCGDMQGAARERFEGRRDAAIEVIGNLTRVAPDLYCQAELERVAIMREEFIILGAIRVNAASAQQESTSDA
jgi:hypothetical protein